MDAVAWPALIGVLAEVEGVDANDSGLLSFGDEPGGGGIFVERGRICWAAARGLQQRLSDLLRTSSDVPGVDLDRIYQRCRTEGRLLGQTLVEEGWIAPRQLETALRRHSAESLIALCGRGDVLPRWTSRGNVGYAARFTFRPVDVLFDVVALYLPHLQHAARVELAEVDAPERRGGAFYFGSEHDVAVPVAGFGGVTVQDLWTLGCWAMSLPRATRELGTTPSFALASTAAGDTIAVWWRGSLLYAVACDDRSGIAAIAAHHLAADQRSVER